MINLGNRIDRWVWMVQDVMRRWPATMLFTVVWVLAMALYLALGGRP